MAWYRQTAFKTTKQAGRKSDKLTKKETKGDELEEKETKQWWGEISPQPCHALVILITETRGYFLNKSYIVEVGLQCKNNSPSLLLVQFF